MNKSLNVNQQTFLHVKERLDHYRISSTFPIQATNLLAKLLALIDGQQKERIYEKENVRYSQLKAQSKECCGEKVTSQFTALVDEAVRLQLSKHLKQNNQLHLTIITLKQQISSLKHLLSKSHIHNLTLNNTQQKQTSYLENNYMTRQTQLLDQLENLTFNYNQLLDMVHSDDNTDKLYIKKLLKHKNYCSEGSRNHSTQKTKNRDRVVTANEQKYKQPERASNSTHTENHSELALLKEKLIHRQTEIKRLQGKLQFDGINMNRILKDFNESRAKQQRTKLNERVQFLEKQSHQHQQENAKMKKQGGDKQALRDHVNKLRDENLSLKLKLEAMKKKQKEGEFDDKKQKKENQRKLNQTSGNLDKLMKQKVKDETKANELQRRQRLLQNQINELSAQLQSKKQQASQLSQANQSLQKQLDSQKLMKQYQRQQFNQRQVQLTDRLNLVKQKEQVMNMGLLRENELLKETVGNLQRVQQQVMKRNSFINESTNIERTVDNNHHQLNQFYRHQLAQTKNKLYSRQAELIKKQNQSLNLALTLEKAKQQLQHLRQQATALRQQSHHNIHLETKLSQLTHELHTSQDLLELEKTKTFKYQAQLSDYDKINQQFIKLKEQYFILQKSEKEKLRGMEMKIAELEEIINLKVIKLEEKEIQVRNLQTQLIDANEKLRKANRELALLDEDTHKLRMDKSRLEKKYTELLADYTMRKQSEKASGLIKQTQLLSEIDQLNRDLQKYKLIHEEHQTQLNELSIAKTQNERQLQEMDRLIDLQKQQIENHKQRQQLYEMEIRELKDIVDAR